VEGSTENATLVTDLLVGLRDRGLEVTRPVLVVVDGSKALSAALRAVFDHPVMARCQLHKIRNVVSKLPGSHVASMTGRLYAFLQPPLLASCYRNPLPVSNQEGARRPRQVGT
jgi:transposase-like protein